MSSRKITKIGTLLAIAVAGVAASQVDAAMMLDLRFSDGSKLVAAPTAGVSYTVSLYAVFDGADADLNNESLTNIYTGIKSDPAGTLFTGGGVTGTTFVAPFNNNAVAGTLQDLNGDGIIDVGGASLTSTAGWVFLRASAAVTTSLTNATVSAVPGYDREFKIGSFTISATGLGSGTESFNAVVPPDFMGTNKTISNGGAVFSLDGTTNNKSSANIVLGSAIVFGESEPVVTASVSLGAATLANIADSDNLWKPDGVGHNYVDILKGGPGEYISEVDDLIPGDDLSGKHVKGSVALNSITVGEGPTLVMLWLDGTTSAIAALVNSLDAAGGTNYDIALASVGSGDALYADIQKLMNDSNWYTSPAAGGPFNALIKFGNPSSTAFFNFDFTGTGVKLDKIAAVPEPASLGLLALGALGLIGRRRKA